MSTAIATLRTQLPSIARPRRAARLLAGRRRFVPGPLLLFGALWLLIGLFVFRGR